MAQYTVKAGDSWARIAGAVYGNQRWYNELAQRNGGLGRMLHPGDVIDAPDDFDLTKTPFIPQGTFNNSPTGYNGNQPVSRSAAPTNAPAPVAAAGLKLPNVGLPALPQIAQPNYFAGEKRGSTAVPPAWQTGSPAAGAPLLPAGTQRIYPGGKGAAGPGGAAGDRFKPWLNTNQAAQTNGRQGGTPIATPPLKGWNTFAPISQHTPNPYGVPAYFPAAPGNPNPKPVFNPMADRKGYAQGGRGGEKQPRPWGPGVGPQDMFRPLSPFEKNTGAVFLGDAINNAIAKGDRTLLPPILEDGYWQNMGGMDEAFLESIGYRFQDDGTWRLFNPKKVAGYGGGGYGNGGGNFSAPFEAYPDYGDYGGGGYGGGSGYDSGPRYGPSQARSGFGSDFSLVNWRIG